MIPDFFHPVAGFLGNGFPAVQADNTHHGVISDYLVVLGIHADIFRILIIYIFLGVLVGARQVRRGSRIRVFSRSFRGGCRCDQQQEQHKQEHSVTFHGYNNHPSGSVGRENRDEKWKHINILYRLTTPVKLTLRKALCFKGFCDIILSNTGKGPCLFAQVIKGGTEPWT